MNRKKNRISEVEVLKKLSLAGLAKLSLLRYSCLGFCKASAGYRGLGIHNMPMYSTLPDNSQLIPQSMMKYPGLPCLA
jgi:hypothetical protein